MIRSQMPEGVLHIVYPHSIFKPSPFKIYKGIDFPNSFNVGFARNDAGHIVGFGFSFFGHVWMIFK